MATQEITFFFFEIHPTDREKGKLQTLATIVVRSTSYSSSLKKSGYNRREKTVTAQIVRIKDSSYPKKK